MLVKGGPDVEDDAGKGWVNAVVDINLIRIRLAKSNWSKEMLFQI